MMTDGGLSLHETKAQLFALFPCFCHIFSVKYLEAAVRKMNKKCKIMFSSTELMCLYAPPAVHHKAEGIVGNVFYMRTDRLK